MDMWISVQDWAPLHSIMNGEEVQESLPLPEGEDVVFLQYCNH